ncbi:MAG: type IV secretion protein DotN [Pseudomonadota bacterium]|nr:type IV secretion protein DotN [Pseudomonadota bacterium]
MKNPSGGAWMPPPAADTSTRAAVLKRDKNTCRYCGFASEKHQVVRWHEGQAKTKGVDAFVTACLFCDQCFALETAGMAGSGVLVWLPEMDQARINHICRAAYVARAEGGDLAEAAQTAFDSLIVRRYEIRRLLRTDDPLVLATVLADTLSDAEYAKRGQKLDGVRLLPLDRRIVRRGNKDVDVFPEMLTYWRAKNGPFRGVAPGSWASLLEKIGGGHTEA